MSFEGRVVGTGGGRYYCLMKVPQMGCLVKNKKGTGRIPRIFNRAHEILSSDGIFFRFSLDEKWEMAVGHTFIDCFLLVGNVLE